MALENGMLCKMSEHDTTHTYNKLGIANKYFLDKFFGATIVSVKLCTRAFQIPVQRLRRLKCVSCFVFVENKISFYESGSTLLSMYGTLRLVVSFLKSARWDHWGPPKHKNENIVGTEWDANFGALATPPLIMAPPTSEN